MKGLNVACDLTPGRRPRPGKREARPGRARASGLTEHRERLVELAAELLLGRPLSRRAIMDRYQVSRPTAGRDLRVIQSTLGRIRGVTLSRQDGGVWTARIIGA
jgi:hypothetical protein